ncbi:hypothetical protein [Antrihabitans cavernicola]|uniref:Polyketide cyclase n=1 Tax=Antrihabitans cavernicola TaxID=2495913 RepID=A0A5A7SJR4_9NOCA|nr:hypothetical protein [Spelaeibacter cavernicola]KAA0024431.1 hypothetical protein FOY51_00210 [Spelaeibacter cavernicola]
MTDKFVQVTADVAPSAASIFAVLANPAKHVEMDGSGMLVLARAPEVITAVGQIFAMSMKDEQGRSYEVDNHVAAFDADRHIAWLPGAAGAEPLGIRWDWVLEPTETDTRVTQRCDWSQVTNERYLATFTLPRVSAEKMRASIEKVADLASRVGEQP